MGENKYLDLDGLKNLVDNIKNGNLVSGKSISDASGNSITDTYATRLYAHAQSNGFSDSMSYHTGRAGLTENHEVDQFRYRNIEGLWGNCGEYTDDLIMKNLKYYFTFDQSKYGNIDNYTKLSYEGQGDSVHKYNWKYIRVKRMGFDRRFPALNLPCEITGWNSNPEPYYGDVMTAYKDVDYSGNDISNTEFICVSSLGWDGGYGNGPYCYRFWQTKDNAQWLYSTRMIYRTL